MKYIKFLKARILVILILGCLVCWGTNRLIYYRNQRSVDALSWALAEKVIMVDPGHGGVDPGAVGKDNVLEKDIVLEVGHRLAAYLKQGGARVVMTRETDTDLSDPEVRGLYARKCQDLARRVALANKINPDILVSIHINSFPDSTQHGAQTFSQPGSSDSHRLALAIQTELNRMLKEGDRVPLTGDYYIIRESRVPAVIVEIGFLSNPREFRLLQESAYQTRIAWCLYAGIVRYFAEQRLSASQH